MEREHVNGIHLGCGSRIIAGFTNLDLSPPAEMPAELEQLFISCDLRHGLPMVRAASVPLIYTEHFLEHLSRHEGLQLLRECHRVLAPGGVMRASVPGLRILVDKYLDASRGDHGALCFADAVGWRPSTAAQLLNGGMREWEHLFMYDEAELQLVFMEAGFAKPTMQKHGVSFTPGMPTEGRPFLGDVVVEVSR